MNIKEHRVELGISSVKAARACGMPYRTYIRYEQDPNYGNEFKRNYIIDTLNKTFEISEEKGVLTLDMIKSRCYDVLSRYPEVSFCYLFGSYAKGYAKDNSDVDLVVCCGLTGIRFVGLIEELRNSLQKRVDLIRLQDLENNIDLVKEVMKDGIKVYEQCEG